MRHGLDTIAAVIGVIGVISAAILFGVVSYMAPDLNEIYDPSRSDDQIPKGFRQLLARDAIRPI